MSVKPDKLELGSPSSAVALGGAGRPGGPGRTKQTILRLPSERPLDEIVTLVDDALVTALDSSRTAVLSVEGDESETLVISTHASTGTFTFRRVTTSEFETVETLHEATERVVSLATRDGIDSGEFYLQDAIGLPLLK